MYKLQFGIPKQNLRTGSFLFVSFQIRLSVHFSTKRSPAPFLFLIYAPKDNTVFPRMQLGTAIILQIFLCPADHAVLSANCIHACFLQHNNVNQSEAHTNAEQKQPKGQTSANDGVVLPKLLIAHRQNMHIIPVPGMAAVPGSISNSLDKVHYSARCFGKPVALHPLMRQRTVFVDRFSENYYCKICKAVQNSTENPRDSREDLQ